ncbi:MAG: pyridoxal phosphate-dependent aminotransferase [Deltaproteobacteria bacterium]|nr:pyridoxal phosphate-dependent aminotransferase [Deltaproteobacteria bacterium]
MRFEEFYNFKETLTQNFKNLVDLSFINPSSEIESPILRNFYDLLSKARLGYTPSVGLPDVRIACANFWKGVTNSNYSIDSFIPSYGTKDALALFSRSMLLPHQKVFLMQPFYPVYYYHCLANQLIPTTNVSEADAIVFSLPHNPTGTVFLDELSSLLNQVRLKPETPVFLDCVYAPLWTDEVRFLDELRTSARFLIESFSISKCFGAGGVRTGFITGSKGALQLLSRVRSRIDYSVSILNQHFLVSVLTSANQIIDRLKHYFRHRRLIFDSFGLAHLTNSLSDLPFLWIKHEQISRKLFEHLAFNGFLTVWGGFYGEEWSNCLRISLTIPEVEIARFCQMLVSELNIKITDEALNI